MIDFSCKRNVLIRDEFGTIQRMDEPYFRSQKIADGTWQVLSDGDFTYLVEGKNEALVIDSGYGCGNIREYCQSLTSKPISRIANTHDHFDHTANNSYFDCAYMSKETATLATIPFPSFSGINFPRDYNIQVIGEGYVFHLGERDLETFFIPNHAVGSLAFLDRSRRILFSGDEIQPGRQQITRTVTVFLQNMEKLAQHRKAFDLICAGSGIVDAVLLDKYIQNAKYILAGHEGEPVRPFAPPQDEYDADGRLIYGRQHPRPCDVPKGSPGSGQYRRIMRYADCEIVYDIRNVT